MHVDKLSCMQLSFAIFVSERFMYIPLVVTRSKKEILDVMLNYCMD